MTEVHHFAFGAFNPVGAFLLAFLGSFFGLLCTGRAREARTRSRRTRWLIIAAFSIGGAAIWLMHFTAMLGFDVPASQVRYDVALTLGSLGLSVMTVGCGLVIVGHGPRRPVKILGSGVVTGIGVLAMHYTGMFAMHVPGEIHYEPTLVAASVVIAVVAATAALWFTVSVRGWAAVTGAAVIMAVAVCGMHDTGMAALRVELSHSVTAQVSGIRPLMMIVPITLITATTLLGLAFSGLQAMTEEEFTDGAAVPRRGQHAEKPWSLKHASMTAIRRTPSRPSPRPVADHLAADHLAADHLAADYLAAGRLAGRPDDAPPLERETVAAGSGRHAGAGPES